MARGGPIRVYTQPDRCHRLSLPFPPPLPPSPPPTPPPPPPLLHPPSSLSHNPPPPPPPPPHSSRVLTGLSLCCAHSNFTQTLLKYHSNFTQTPLKTLPKPPLKLHSKIRSVISLRALHCPLAAFNADLTPRLLGCPAPPRTSTAFPRPLPSSRFNKPRNVSKRKCLPAKRALESLSSRRIHALLAPSA